MKERIIHSVLSFFSNQDLIKQLEMRGVINKRDAIYYKVMDW